MKFKGIFYLMFFFWTPFPSILWTKRVETLFKISSFVFYSMKVKHVLNNLRVSK